MRVMSLMLRPGSLSRQLNSSNGLVRFLFVNHETSPNTQTANSLSTRSPSSALLPLFFGRVPLLK